MHKLSSGHFETFLASELLEHCLYWYLEVCILCHIFMANFNFLIKISEHLSLDFIAFGVGYLYINVDLHNRKTDSGGLSKSKSFHDLCSCCLLNIWFYKQQN